MCGIVGVYFFDPEQAVHPHQIQQMCDTIVHRGPDDEGQYVDGPIGLGMRRLSIIDLAGGHQPIYNEDGTLVIVYNGEIYNHRELRRALQAKGHRFQTVSDTECILHAYEEYGTDCLQYLNGMFAIAIWDVRQQQLFLARDRIGIKPLYFYQDTSHLRFASEIKALLKDSTVPRELDEESFSYFFRYGYVAPPGTLFRGIRKVRPGHYLLANRQGVTFHRYWSIAYREEATHSDGEYAEALYETFKQSVQRQLISDVPLGAFLSGGMDSTSIVHLMREVTGTTVSTYSIGFKGEDAFHNELSDAKVNAKLYETHHHEIIVEPDVTSLIPKLVYHLDEPLADSSFVVTYLVSQLARESVTVILSGVGGDELFGGYRRYLGPRLGRYYDWIPRPIQKGIASVAAHLPVDRGSSIKNSFRLARSFITTHELPLYEHYDHLVQLMSPSTWSQLCPVITSMESPLLELRREYFQIPNAQDPVTRMLCMDLHTSLVESLLLLTDKMSMATSLEARVPFLDNEMVELAARIPPSLKVRGTQLRHIQKRSMRGRLPSQVLKKRKRGFGCPIGTWFRKDLAPLLNDLISPTNVKKRGLFDAVKVEEIIIAHAEYRQDYTDLLLALLTFELWYQQWLD
ncbi:asparagine synthase (glutamine-hydrolyzing) [Candidatus Poribacteria bacterium]|nr:asparagine synthase (glutamine-hydrolyzing) [Candidatus Poribacteria bacterium]